MCSRRSRCKARADLSKGLPQTGGALRSVVSIHHDFDHTLYCKRGDRSCNSSVRLNSSSIPVNSYYCGACGFSSRFRCSSSRFFSPASAAWTAGAVAAAAQAVFPEEVGCTVAVRSAGQFAKHAEADVVWPPSACSVAKLRNFSATRFANHCRFYCDRCNTCRSGEHFGSRNAWDCLCRHPRQRPG